MTTQTKVSTNQPTINKPLSRFMWITPLAILISTVVNLGLYIIIGSLIPEVTAWEGASSAQIIGANSVYLLIGTFVFMIVKRRSEHMTRNYWIVATIGLLFSLVMPITAGMGFGPPDVPPAGIATVITLCLMHVISYAISVPLFIRLGTD